MGEQQRLQHLCRRLRELRQMEVAAWQRSIVEAAIQGVEEEIDVCTRSLRRWQVGAPGPGVSVALRRELGWDQG